MAVPVSLGELMEALVMQAGSPVGKKRTHRVRGASLSPRGKSQDGTGAADESSEPDTAAASPGKPGSEGGLVEGEGMEAPGTPDESVESAVLTPRSLSTGSALPVPTVQSCLFQINICHDLVHGLRLVYWHMHMLIWHGQLSIHPETGPKLMPSRDGAYGDRHHTLNSPCRWKQQKTDSLPTRAQEQHC